MSAVITADDVILDNGTKKHVMSYIENWRSEQSSRLSVYGKTLMPQAQDLYYAQSIDEVKSYGKWLTKVYEYAEYLASHPALFANWLESDDDITVRHAGIEGRFRRDYVIAKVKREAVERLLVGIATPSTEHGFGWNANSIAYEFNEPRFADSYLGDPNESLLNRAVWYAKREAVLGMDYLHGIDFRASGNKLWLITSNPAETHVDIAVARSIKQLVDTLNSGDTLNIDKVKRARQRVLLMQSAHEGEDQVMRKRLASQAFTAYWDTMKTRQRAKVADPTATAEAWATIPIPESGTATSRTWGIEVETVRYNDTSRPRGWRDVHDGSLPSDDEDSGGCDCGCNVCDYGDHCDIGSNDCYYNDGGGSGNTSRELVSPVLSHFNSTGLQQICSDLGDDEDSTAPGIHVHIGADDLTVVDIARLLYAYGVVAPLIEPLYHREVFGYCKEMGGNNVQWWLSRVKTYLRDNGSLPEPREICYDQPADRYQDVNLHALSKHGTVEFRAMGPFYNYGHLVRWAWFVREMANVARLNLPQHVWTDCKNLADVIHLLRKYGQELPLDKAFTNNELALASIEE